MERRWQRWCSSSLSQFLLSIQRLHPQWLFLCIVPIWQKGKCLHNIGIKIVLSSLVVWKCWESYEFQRTYLKTHFIETSGIYWEPTNPSAPSLSLGLDSTEQLLWMARDFLNYQEGDSWGNCWRPKAKNNEGRCPKGREQKCHSVKTLQELYSYLKTVKDTILILFKVHRSSHDAFF